MECSDVSCDKKCYDNLRSCKKKCPCFEECPKGCPCPDQCDFIMENHSRQQPNVQKKKETWIDIADEKHVNIIKGISIFLVVIHSISALGGCFSMIGGEAKGSQGLYSLFPLAFYSVGVASVVKDSLICLKVAVGFSMFEVISIGLVGACFCCAGAKDAIYFALGCCTWFCCVFDIVLIVFGWQYTFG